MPILHLSPEGRAFLSRADPRAFAVGEPAESCPARAEAGGPSSVDAAGAALSACFRQLDQAQAGAGCGCRLLALDDQALAPQGDFAYAPGVFARAISPELGFDFDLSASEGVGPQVVDPRLEAAEGARRLDFFPRPGGEPAAALILPSGEAAMTLLGDFWHGRAEREGLSRGRLRERLLLTREDGARLIVVVGWEPLAFAAERDRLTRWGGD